MAASSTLGTSLANTQASHSYVYTTYDTALRLL